jgi:predicted AlkP superfamily phosphohydrolase/phosphomutase
MAVRFGVGRWTAVVALALGLVACGGTAPSATSAPAAAGDGKAAAEADGRHPWVLIGIDGGEQRLVDRLWKEGRLPAMRALAERGQRGVLGTAFSQSPVIWTTMATGMQPGVHGIEDFVVRSPDGLQVPVSSAQRRVPALWNMLTEGKRRVAVAGWWATWPAEEVNGVVISDRALLAELSNRTYPPELAAELDHEARTLDPKSWPDLGSSIGAARDLAMAHWGKRLAAGGYDLTMVYFRSPDLVSHEFWRFVEPEHFPPLDADELAMYAETVPRVYDAVDREIAAIVAAAPPDANILVVSDHGFEAREQEQLRVEWDANRLLEELGFLVRTASGEVDEEASRIWARGAPSRQRIRHLVLRGGVADPRHPRSLGTDEELLEELRVALEQVRFSTGEQAFTAHAPSPAEARRGAEATLRLAHTVPTPALWLGEHQVAGVIVSIGRLSGTHDEDTHGLYLAAGPDIAPGPQQASFSIFDITPTLLYGLGLPVADDFAGEVYRGLFRPAFLAANPPRRVDSWGRREATEQTTSAADEALVEELRALGYLD